ncbi:MAG: FxsA family protein [Neisseriaceae bacterium]|nr:FxsA family protein [Neisseriaceae bacterium]MBP6861938.1 FxsA family protein [Neisseriaceae bacterium]
MRIFGFGWLFLILEILSIVMMTSAIGGFNTILWMLCTFIIGVMMLRHFGRINMAMMNAGLRTSAPGSFMAAIWPIRFALAAILLLSPGIFSDVLAVVIMLPIWHIGGRFSATTSGQQDTRGAYHRRGPANTDADSDIIEGEYHEVNPREPRRGEQPTLPKDD